LKRHELPRGLSGIDRKIVEHIKESPKGRSYLSELENMLGVTKRRLMLHLVCLVHRRVLSFEYETCVRCDGSPFVIKWYTLRRRGN